MSLPPKAQSVTQKGETDGWEPSSGYHGELEPSGGTRIVASVASGDLPAVHLAVIDALAPPLSVLYRQKVNRQNPRPNGAPPRDWVAVLLDPDRVKASLRAHASLAYHDARAEIWVRGSMGEQVVLDTDSMLFCYPDDPSFRDALDASGVPERSVQTMAERDYVKHWYHAECDEHETGLFADLGLSEVPHRKG